VGSFGRSCRQTNLFDTSLRDTSAAAAPVDEFVGAIPLRNGYNQAVWRKRPRPPFMTDVTQILSQIERGDSAAAERLLILVYAELRRLAAQKLAHEKPGQTLDATGLVHEAYLRLFQGNGHGDGERQHWDGRGHFFAAAAEAMRRILIENARRKKRVKHGGDRQRVTLLDEDLAIQDSPDELLSLDAALANLALEDSTAAQLVKLRVFTGLSIEQAGDVLGFSRATAFRHWNYARAWLRCEIEGT
jgi:RNA polymerase sigma factor (TIGR02999 family)